MEELVNLVVEKTGMSEEQAKQAIDTVLDYVKEKLPEPLAGQLDNLLEGGVDMDGAGNLLKGLGGLFGG